MKMTARIKRLTKTTLESDIEASDILNPKTRKKNVLTIKEDSVVISEKSL